MSNSTEKLTAYAKGHKLVTGCIVTGVVALVAIGGVMAWSNGSNASNASDKKPAVVANDDNKKQTENKQNATDDEQKTVVSGSAANDNSGDNGSAGAAQQTASIGRVGNLSTGVITSTASAPAASTPSVTPTNPSNPANPSQPGQGNGGTTPVQPGQGGGDTTPTQPGQGGGTTTPPASSTNLFVNGTVEAGTDTTADGWGTVQNPNDMVATFARVANGHNNSRSLSIDVTAPGSVLTANEYRFAQWSQTASMPVTANNTYTFSHYYKANVATQIDIEYVSATGSTYDVLADVPAASDWTQFSKTFTVPAGVSAVNIYHAIAQVGSLQTDDYSLVAGSTAPTNPTTPTSPTDPGTTPTNPTNPTNPGTPSTGTGARVSLTFDDGWKSIYANGLPILQKYGFKSTQYVNSQPTLDSYSGYYTIDNIAAFNNAGHEIAWHTNTHNNALQNINSVDQATLTAELKPNATFVQQLMNVGVTLSSNYASPFGTRSAAAVSTAQANGFNTYRTTDDGYNLPGQTDLTYLKVKNVCGVTGLEACGGAKTTAAQVATWISEAQAQNAWLIIVFHEVAYQTTVEAQATGTACDADPADGGPAGACTVDQSYAVTPADLDAMLQVIKTSGINVQTVRDAVAAIK